MKVELMYPIVRATGSLSKDSEFYLRQQKNGKIIACKKPVRKPKPTAKQLAQQARFRAVQDRFKQVMQTVELRVPYEIEWELHHQKRYPVFRFWLKSKISEEMKGEAAE